MDSMTQVDGVVLLSGGMDSATLLYRCLDEGRRVAALSVDYGQRHRIELEAARKIATEARVLHDVADLSAITRFLAGSSQTSRSIAVPEGHYADASMRVTVVPNRNMLMLSVAVAWTIMLGGDFVAYAAHAGDHAIYPDCRPQFVQALREATALCHYAPVDLIAPYAERAYTKADIVQEGVRLGVPYALTHSCYQGERVHCGKCGTCVERREAFEVAGVEDPTVYAL